MDRTYLGACAWTVQCSRRAAHWFLHNQETRDRLQLGCSLVVDISLWRFPTVRVFEQLQ